MSGGRGLRIAPFTGSPIGLAGKYAKKSSFYAIRLYPFLIVITARVGDRPNGRFFLKDQLILPALFCIECHYWAYPSKRGKPTAAFHMEMEPFEHSEDFALIAGVHA